MCGIADVFAFTTRRRCLAIIDLGQRAAQPMLSADGETAIVFNGKICNYRELRADLQRLGEHPRTESDTEVLLLFYPAPPARAPHASVSGGHSDPAASLKPGMGHR